MTALRPVLATALAAVLLAGCGSDPAGQRRSDVAALTAAANQGDAEGVRERADALLATVSAQRERDEIPVGEADRLTALVKKVRSGADAIDERLLEQRRVQAEAEAEAARQQLEQERAKAEEERKKVEEERKKAEEAAREAAEEDAREDGDGKGKGKDGESEKDD